MPFKITVNWLFQVNVINYFFPQFIYKFISITLCSMQPSFIWQLRNIELLPNKRKVN